MKKIKSLCLISVLACLLTGCVKFNANMDIKKDKSMDFSIIYAIDTSVFGEMDALEAEDKKELEEQGFTVTEYAKDSMQGYTLTKKVKNIDEVSSSDDVKYDLSGILNTNEEKSYIFNVKKGIFKNTYTAKFQFDTADSNLNTDIEDTEEDFDWSDTDTDDDNTYGATDNETDTDWSFDTEENNEEENNSTTNDFSNLDFSSMMASMDLSFNVTLPYAAKSNNATNVNNDGKSLSWTLSNQDASEITFEFELYNMMPIYIIFGAIILAIIVVIVLIILNKKKNNKNTFGQTDMNVDIVESQPIERNIVEQINHASNWSQDSVQPTPEVPVQSMEGNVMGQNNFMTSDSQISSQSEILGQNMVNSPIEQVNFEISTSQNLVQPEQNAQIQPTLQQNNINESQQNVNQPNNYSTEQNSNNLNNDNFKW